MKPYSPIIRLPGGAPILAALLIFFCFFKAPYVVFAADTATAELLEQGVYSEETKGDIDAAMLLYQQVIAKADANQAVAAQAQFRLAGCLDKKKDYAGATAAFEKLIRDYPNQKELVAFANEYLADGVTLRPAPWADSEDQRYDLSLPSGFKIGFARMKIDADTLNGRKIWRLNSHLFVGLQQWSRTEVDAASFRPIHSRWKHTLIGEAEVVYTPGRATVKTKGKDQVQNVDLAGAIYDNEEAIQLMRRLPLAAGYSTKMSLLVGLTGGNLIPIQLDVTGPESVTVPAGTFDCFKVELNIKQTFWFSSDAHHYLVKFEAGGVIAALASVPSNQPTEPARMVDSIRNFSVLVPAGWMAERKPGPDGAKRTEFILLDPEAIAVTNVKVENLENYGEAARVSVRAFAEHQVEQGKKYSKEFVVRADSWTNTTVAGQPAVSFIADAVVQGNLQQTVRGIFAFVDGMAVDISSYTSKEDCESFRPKTDAIAASYKGK